MMNKKNLLLIIILFTQVYNLYSQTLKVFPSDPDKFLEAVTQFLRNEELEPQTKKEIKEFMEETFATEWTKGKFTDEYKKEVYQTCNTMLTKKMKAYPHFYNYLQCQMLIVNSKLTDDGYFAWQKGLKYVLNLPIGYTNAFNDYVLFTKNLLKENSIYKSSTTTWLSDNNDFNFQFDSVPKLIFKSLNLTCIAKGDTAFIYNTQGVYYPLGNRWVGVGGRVDWTRAGFDKNEIYAELKNYTIIMKYSKYTADSVVFYNNKYFNHPLLGQLEDRVLANKKGENASFPTFDSYNKHLEIKELFKNINYEGGFLMKGSKIIGNGSKEESAHLYIYREGKKFMTAESKTFLIRKDRLASPSTSITIYLDKEDSIYHPSLRMKYLKDKNELSLVREESGLGPSPFFDSYHKLDMYFEALYWKMDSMKIDMKMIKGLGNMNKASFESSNYYEESRFNEIQGMNDIHPLQIISNCSKKYQSKTLTLMQLAKFMKHSPDDVRGLLFDISNRGFIIYNMEDDYFIIKDKLFDYLKARGGKTDYDFLKFNSAISAKSNATLSLLNYELKLNGINHVLLSDSQNVFIYPTNQELTIYKNRDFTFSGRVHAGLFDFYGKQYYFDYNQFKIDMPNVDSLSFQVRSKTQDKNGEYPLVRVNTVIEDIKGDLKIDYPTNKSGLKPYKEYPIFNSKKNSYVYYERKSIYNNVYKRDNFYFFVKPFTIDSLQTFSTEGLSFAGTMKTANIFPDFEENLKVQDDYSLGFIRSTPPGGFPAYDGKGKFTSTIKMSHKGLKGDGILDYLTSTSKSVEFNFFPDSVNAVAYDYNMIAQKGDVEYPPVKTEDVYEQWYPHKDLMVITKIKTPIYMYNGQAKLSGYMDVTPRGVVANGIQNFRDAELESKRMNLKHHIIDADTADFGLRSIDLTQFSIKTHNYKSSIDFELRKGTFKANEGKSMVEFPINKYICYIDEFEWEMDKDEIGFSNNEKHEIVEQYDKKTLAELADVDIFGSRWVSVHPEQDSLEFYSPKAIFSVKRNVIKADEVKIIKVADAAIYPSDGKVTILSDAEMVPLEKAQILANLVSKYHVFYNATVNITSKKKFKATANYDYIDENKEKQKLYFDLVSVDTTGQTYADGKISSSANFTLSPYFEFQGNVNLLASMEFLTFDGVCRIRQHCDSTRSWLKFKAEINPNEIYIPVPEQNSPSDTVKTFAAMLISNDTTGIYSAFIQPRKHYSDKVIVSSKGFLFYDKVSSEYRISSKEKLKQLSFPGDYLSLGVHECVVYGEGNLQFGTDLGQVKLNALGNIKYQVIPDTADLNMVLAIDFLFSENCMKIISESLEKSGELKGINLSSLTYSKALGQILGTEQADKIISDINVYGFIKRFPEELRHTLFLADVNFAWNQKTRSYISNGQIGIGGIYKTQINKYVNGYIEIEKQRGGDAISIYLEPSSSEWYFFNYKKGLMQVISSNEDFNKIIKEMKPKDKTMDVKRGETPYTFNISTIKKKESFVNKFKSSN